jgi:hypothetical protein
MNIQEGTNNIVVTDRGKLMRGSYIVSMSENNKLSRRKLSNNKPCLPSGRNRTISHFRISIYQYPISNRKGHPLTLGEPFDFDL